LKNAGLTLRISFLTFFAGCALASSVVAKEWPPTVFVSPCTCKGNHGEDRWKAKTDTALVPSDLTPIRSVTPSEMYGWRPLAGLTDASKRKAPEEAQWYRVVGRVVEVKAEADGDVHFELKDASGRKRGTILAEVPLGKHWCAVRQAVFSWTKKGLLFPKFQASSNALPLRVNPVVTVYGKAFFDTHHAAKNPLANRSRIDPTGTLAAWEIHPVARIDQVVEVRRAIFVRGPRAPR
jgi:hypothetical protein